MPNKDGLITAYLLDKKGGGKKIGWEEIESWSPEQGLLWVHFDYTSPKTKQWIHKKSGLDPLTAEAMLFDESRPRAVVNNHSMMVFLRSVNLNPGQDPEDMVSIRTWLDENRIITTRERKLFTIDDIEHAISDNNGPKTTVEFLKILIERLSDRISDVIESIDERVDDLDEEVITAESHLLRPKIADIRRESILLRRYLAPQREALNRLTIEDSSLFTMKDRLQFREAMDRFIRYIEDLDSARERATITQEELTSRLSEQLDSRMYLLSVVAVIFLPLTFLTGLLGINVGGIPGAEDKWGFTIVCGGLVALLLITLVFLRRRKWI